MTGITRRAAVKALASLTGLSAVTGVTAGQEATNATEATDAVQNATEEVQETATEAAENAAEYIAQITTEARLLDYSLSVDGDETATISALVELDKAQQVVTSDLLGGVSSEGVSSVEQQSKTMPSGRGRLKMEVGIFDDEFAAMGLAVPGGAITISTGLPDQQGEQVGLVEGTALGIGTMGIGTGAAAWRHNRDDLDQPEDWGDDSGGLL